MKSCQQYALATYNTFAVQSVCSTIYFPSSVEDLKALPDLSQQKFYILGDGSNTLFTDSTTSTIIKPMFSGIEVTETKDSYILKVGASENWHQLVCYCIENNINGLENLALIPGSTGAAPVQNIGAYGVELADFCIEVEWFDFKNKTLLVIPSENCQFSYRDSVFKKALLNKGLITSVSFKFDKNWQANLSYGGLDSLPKNVRAKQVMEKVIELRQSKLPDPNILPNAGSFFKNPIVENNTYLSLINTYPSMPHYKQGNGQMKLAAGWLIEQAGLKGYRQGSVGVHDKQALVLVNYDHGSGLEIVHLAKYVQSVVFNMFAVKIEPEVRMITADGEVSFETLMGKNFD
jgi:UDP-N-acetylmuramate dehydrogenase